MTPEVPEHWHCIPTNDLREHELSPECWCGPWEDEDCDGMLVHNSADERELFEDGRRAPS